MLMVGVILQEVLEVKEARFRLQFELVCSLFKALQPQLEQLIHLQPQEQQLQTTHGRVCHSLLVCVMNR